MERLREREAAGEQWDLRSDRHLLAALQDLSGDIMAALQRLETGLTGLESGAARLETGVATAHAAFRELSHSKFVEQDVAAEAPDAAQPPKRRPPALTAENFAEVVHPQWAEALSLAAAAVNEHQPAAAGRLPFIFGSPEYLQDASFGLEGGQREPEQLASVPPTEAAEQAEARDSNVQEGSDPAAVPDFKSLLEAALRGELDESVVEGLTDAGSAPGQAQPGAAMIAAERPATGGEQRTEGSEGEGLRQAAASGPEAGGAALEPALSLEELLEGDGELFSEAELRS